MLQKYQSEIAYEKTTKKIFFKKKTLSTMAIKTGKNSDVISH